MDIVSLGVVETTTLQEGLHKGDIVLLFLPSTLEHLGGCSRSGESARLKRGDPGSADFGRLNDDFFAAAEFGVKLAPGLKTKTNVLINWFNGTVLIWKLLTLAESMMLTCTSGLSLMLLGHGEQIKAAAKLKGMVNVLEKREWEKETGYGLRGTTGCGPQISFCLGNARF